MKKNLYYYSKKARSEKWALPQFNFSTFGQLRAIFQAASSLKSPIILGTSEGESKYFGLEEAVTLKNLLCKKFGIPAFLNLDHGKDLDYIKKAIFAGYESVHFDGSFLSFEENVKVTKQIVQLAEKKGVLVEGEIDRIPDASEAIKESEKKLTDPEKVLEFLKGTKADRVAVNLGTTHGLELGENPQINIQRLKEIREVVDDKVFLILHGGSGTPEDNIKEAIENGIVKININTELRLAFIKELRNFLNNNPEEIKPYKIFPSAIEAVQKVVEEKIKILGSSNRI